MDMLAAGPPSFAGLGGGDASPCQRTDVREWNHLDPLTGDRLRARLQADRWIVGQGGRYDKVCILHIHFLFTNFIPTIRTIVL